MELFSQHIPWQYSQPVMPVKTGIQKTAPRPLTLDSAPVLTGVTRRNDKTRLQSGCAGLYCSLIQNIGASPVTLPGAHQCMALQRGTVDGTAYVCYTLDTYNLKEVVKYIVTPPILPCIFVDFYVNLQAWKQLPEKTRRILNDVALECFQWFTDASLRADVETVKRAQEKYGLGITSLPKQDVARLRQAAIPVLEVAAKKSHRSTEFLELLKEFMKYKGILE